MFFCYLPFIASSLILLCELSSLFLMVLKHSRVQTYGSSSHCPCVFLVVMSLYASSGKDHLCRKGYIYSQCETVA